MCKVLEVSKSGDYACCNRPPAARSQENDRLSQQIATLHQESRQTDGAPRIHAALLLPIAQNVLNFSTAEPNTTCAAAQYGRKTQKPLIFGRRGFAPPPKNQGFLEGFLPYTEVVIIEQPSKQPVYFFRPRSTPIFVRSGAAVL
jgi:hypothetical protein